MSDVGVKTERVDMMNAEYETALVAINACFGWDEHDNWTFFGPAATLPNMCVVEKPSWLERLLRRIM